LSFVIDLLFGIWILPLYIVFMFNNDKLGLVKSVFNKDNIILFFAILITAVFIFEAGYIFGYRRPAPIVIEKCSQPAGNQ